MPTQNQKKSAPKPAAKVAKSKKQSKKVVEAPAPAPVVDAPVDAPVVDTPATPATPVIDSYDEEFKVIGEQLKFALSIVKDLTIKFNQLEKRVSRDHKVMEKKMRGRVKRVHDPNKPPSGFAKPGQVSDELRKFLSLPKDELISRTQVTKRITAYCKEHGLQQEEDKRKINPDATLTKLLRWKKGDDPVTFFNLQKYMKVHYPNKEGVYA
jgi:chromatin remodeling complex protein RSC6